jgi:hypothetical protein
MPTDALLAQGAVIAALLVFSGVVVSGAWLVRRLRLPTDLPDGPRFEPPPPAAVGVCDRASAAAAAALHHRRAALGAAASAAAHAAATAAATIGRDHPAVQAALAAAAAAERAFRGDDLAAAEQEVPRLRAEAERQSELALASAP